MKAPIEDGVVYSPYPGSDIPRCSLYTIIRECLEASPDRTVLVDDSVSLTCSELLVLLQRYAAGFQASGIGEGDRVCVHLSNNVENFVAIYGCIFAGATVILAKTSLTEHELLYQMMDGEATHVLTDAKHTEKLLRVHETVKLKKLFVMGDVPGFTSASRFKEWDENEFREVPVPDPENTVVALSYSSGTTGLPKGIEITHYSIVASFCAQRACLRGGEPDIMLSWSPITHASGLMTIIAVLTKCKCVIASPDLTFHKFVDTVHKFQVTFLLFFPTRLEHTVNEMLATNTRLDTVKHVIVVGGVLSQRLAELTLSAFPNAVSLKNVYGLTEAASCLCAPAGSSSCYTNVGFPFSMVKIKIIDVKTGKTLGPEEHGELCFQSPTSARGYYRKPDATAQLRDADGWYHSGDIAYYDTDGRFYFVGRIKEMIKCRDNQVVPGELEDLLLKRHQGIAEVAVVGVPHLDYGEAPAAFVVLKPTHKDSVVEQDIMDIIAESLATHKHLYGGVYFVDALPKTETGKVQRNVLANSLVNPSQK